MVTNTKSPANPLRLLVWVVVLGAIAVTAFFIFSQSSREAAPRIALITADDTAFWDGLVRGAEDAADDFNVRLTVERADGTREAQTRILFRFRDEGYDGVAISPVDASKQAVALRDVTETCRVVTVDSDSVLSNRLCFVGADNYAAGRSCGELIKQAMPDGARVLIVMGPISKNNGERRRQGVIDELLDRSFGPGRPPESLDEEHSSGAYTIAATVIDEIDQEAAEANVRAALEADPEIDCIVGLFAYSTPAALRAIEAVGREGITVVGFDDNQETLDGLTDGRVYATLAQDQYNYGYDAIRLLADACRGNTRSIPVTETVHLPPIVVTAESVGTFRSDRR